MAVIDERLVNFLAREQAENDGFYTKKMYIDIANGDLLAGILLSQIVYWYLPSKDSTATKLRVVKDGELWLAKGRDDWWEECRITAYQFDRAIKVLCDIGIVEKKIFKFNGNPMIHVRIVPDKFLELTDAYLKAIGKQFDNGYVKEGSKTILDNVENGFSILSKNEIGQSSKSITENTTMITNSKDIYTLQNEIENNETKDILEILNKPPVKRKDDKVSGPKLDALQKDRFEEFWKLYPRKRNKYDAMQVWSSLNPDDELFEAIMAGLKKAVNSKEWKEQEGRFIPYPATWLRKSRWLDEYTEDEMRFDRFEYMMNMRKGIDKVNI